MSQDGSNRDRERVGVRSAKLARAFAGVRVDVSFAAVDVVIVAVSYTAALAIRFADSQGGIAPDWWDGFWTYLPVVVVVHLMANAILGAYGHVWEFASVEEAMRLVIAALVSAVVLVAVLVGIQQQAEETTRLVPLTVVLIGSGVALGGMGAVRFRSRLFSFRRTHDTDVRRTLVVGTGRAAADLARRGATANPPVLVVGFVDDGSQVRRLAGVPVLGRIPEIPSLIETHGIHEVVISSTSGAGVVRNVVDFCVDVDVRLRTLPDIDSVMGAGSIADVRDLELADLLPRSTVTTDLASVRDLIAGRRVLVTGAGGSIGSEIVSQLLGFEPAEVVALDHDEGHLHAASLEWPGDCEMLQPLLLDICDRGALNRAMSEHRPQVIFHAAAHKHVPILENFPEEAVKTNVLGTRNVLDAACRVGAERFVMISTDKAVEPTSVMGASKRVAEMMVQSAASTSRSDIVFSAVRFGNVLGSRGSVVPTFMHQIQMGGPVTVSDPNMLRYFMLTSEAVELVLQAAALATSEEIFVLDMGEPVRIGDLAHRMIRLAGLVPGRDIEVEIVGARPGEKEIEILSHQPLTPSEHPNISIASTRCPEPVTMRRVLSTLESLALDCDRDRLKEVLMAVAWQTWEGDETIELGELPTQRLDASA